MAKAKARARNAAAPRPRWHGLAAWLVIGALAAGGAFWFARQEATGGGGEAIAPPPRGLPHTPDYHSLHVDPENPRRVLLGTHVGVYESTDGGARWRFGGLEGKDAMHFAAAADGTLWVAGHHVLERSRDGGRTWSSVEPKGLPTLDIHGFAVDQASGALWASVAGEGLYRSNDGGATFETISNEVGPSVNAIVVAAGGALYAADAERGVLTSEDGSTWKDALDMPTAGLASNRLEEPEARVLAAGNAVQLLEGSAWREVLDSEGGLGPVTFAPSDPELAYAIAFDRTLYRSTDGGASWTEVK